MPRKQKITQEEIKRLQEVEAVAKEILRPMITANDDGAMWCAFSRDNHQNMPEDRAKMLISRFEEITGFKPQHSHQSAEVELRRNRLLLSNDTITVFYRNIVGPTISISLKKHRKITADIVVANDKLILSTETAEIKQTNVQVARIEAEQVQTPNERKNMNTELKTLVEQWKKERTYRDGGIAAKKTWAKIKKIATPQEQVSLLKSVGN